MSDGFYGRLKLFETSDGETTTPLGSYEFVSLRRLLCRMSFPKTTTAVPICGAQINGNNRPVLRVVQVGVVGDSGRPFGGF